MDNHNQESDPCVVYCTAPPGESKNIAKKLLEENLAACVNITPVQSLYRWNGEFCDDPEDLLIIKSTKECIPELTGRIVQIHPYELPEIIALPITGGYANYLAWVREEVRSGSSSRTAP